MRVATLLVGILSFAVGDEPKQITDGMKARYWRAKAEASAAQAALQSVISDMQTLCGGTVYLDPQGEPSCTKPEEKK